MELKLWDHQLEVIQKLRDGFKNGHRCQLLYAPTGFGKCLAQGTPVIMYDGSIKKVEDVVVGDLLLSPEGEPRLVDGTVFGHDDMYEVVPNKGDPYIVNSRHILSLRMTGNKGRSKAGDGKFYKPNDIVNISIQDYLKSNQTFKHCAKGWRADLIDFKIPDCLPVDPYVLGLWLGDGTTKEPAITNVEPEIIAYIYKFAEDIKGRVSVWDNGNCKTYRICEGDFLSSMRSIGVIGNKHIPHQYKTASVEARRKLLAGIIDTDGYMFMDNFEITLKVKKLADDVCFVARSLGLAAYITKCTKTIKDNGFFGTYYRITISGETDQIPCLVPRKKAKPRKINKNVRNVGITVQHIGRGNYYGFSIAGDKKLFLLGDFTVTHNTEVAIYLMKATAEKYNRAAIVLDRLVLVDQTSNRLTKYKLDHGVFQSGHWKFARNERLQVCSAQTMERRTNFPQVDLLIVDECHITRQQTIDFIKENPEVKVVGLTATPFTKGLGDVYTNVVCGATTGWLVDNHWLTPLKVYIAKEIDMTGAKKVAGEWSQDEVTQRGMKITGDIVQEWIKKTNEVFGKPEKTIVFCAGVAHGASLVQEFAQHGYNFVSISYKDNDDFKRAAIEDFAKPDTQIHGLIATDILTRGFDVPDVKIGVSARPFSKSLSSHIQQMGRVMRPHPSKEFALWLCLAKGSKVLTNKGLVPIDKVSLDHKIWDGTNFVSHGGAVCNGIQKVITYQGLTATPGHLVHTAKGWRTFGYCASKQIKITQTGFGRNPIRISENHRPASLVAGKIKQAIYSCAMRMRELRLSVCDFFEQLTERKNQGLQGLQPAYSRISNVALQQSSGYEIKMYEFVKSSVSSIWRSWRAVQIQWGQRRNSMDYEQSWNSKVFKQKRTFSYSNRQDRPRWELRTWQFKVDFCQSQSTQQARQSGSSKNAQIQNRLSRNSLFGFHIKKIILDWYDRFTNYRKIQTAFSETEREVWDILDAGPYNRFTCEGLLVHNCHSGNFLRFRDDWDEVFEIGVNKLDQKVEKAKKEPTEKEKKESKCPACGFLWPKRSDSCPACGHVRLRKNDIQPVAGILEELVGSAKANRDDKQAFYSELIYIANQRNYNPNWAAHKYRAKYGVWPRGLSESPAPATVKTLNWVKSKNIAYIKKRQALGLR